ncbi:hypothetical protein FALB51S_04111 [Frigidibacter albus]
MSPTRQITSTSVAGLRALGTSGQRSYELISRTMRQRFSAAHAALFAEPVIPDDGNQTDWYTDIAGPIKQLKDLPEADKRRAEERLVGLMDDIRVLATMLRSSDAPDEQRLGEAVGNALSIPGEDSVWIVRTGNADQPFQPILTDWATQPDTRGGVTDRPLIGWAPRRPPLTPGNADEGGSAEQAGTTAETDLMYPPPALQEGSRRGTALWHFIPLWLLLALLTGVVLYLLLPACGLTGLTYFNTCPSGSAPDDSLTDENRRRAVLENRIELLERRIAGANRACVPTSPTPELGLLPEREQDAAIPDPEPDEIDERLEREAANDGEATIALIWDSRADVDLHVTCPAGDTIYFGNKNSARCSGRLDIDMNVTSSRMSNEPIEHAYFTQLQPGQYRIKVVLYNPAVYPQPHNFRVRVTFGEDVREFTGTVSAPAPHWETTYAYAP